MNRHTGAAFGIDSNGIPTERFTTGSQTVVVHYDDIPESDITTVHGLRCTSPVRTIIDIAPDVTPDELETIMNDGLGRGLFTIQEMTSRLSKPDMVERPGAVILRAHLSARY